MSVADIVITIIVYALAIGLTTSFLFLSSCSSLSGFARSGGRANTLTLS